MKKVLLVIAAILITAWVGVWVGATVMSRTHSAREWPAALGRIEEVPGRHPETKLNAEAATLMRLASPSSGRLTSPSPRVLRFRICSATWR